MLPPSELLSIETMPYVCHDNVKKGDRQTDRCIMLAAMDGPAL